MSSVYYPDPTADTPRGNARKAIVSTTNTTPIEAEVTGHGWSTGDSVLIELAADSAADGLWRITVTGTDTFTLDGSVGTGAGGAEGLASNWTTLPNGTYPSDGDLVDATNANTPVENVDNFKPYAALRMGRYRVWDIYVDGADDAGGPIADTAWSTTTDNTASWNWCQNNPLFSFATPAPLALADDLFFITMTTTYEQTAGATVVGLAIGVLDTSSGIWKVPGSAMTMPNNFNGPVTLHGWHQPAAINNTVGLFDIGFILYGNAGSPPTIELKGDWSITVVHYRPNT